MLGPHNRVCLTTPNTRFEHLAVPLVGEHQAINCGLALSVIDRSRRAAWRSTICGNGRAQQSDHSRANGDGQSRRRG
jgi:hypothetical protein